MARIMQRGTTLLNTRRKTQIMTDGSRKSLFIPSIAQCKKRPNAGISILLDTFLEQALQRSLMEVIDRMRTSLNNQTRTHKGVEVLASKIARNQ